MLAMKLQNQIIPRLGDADGAGTTGREAHRAPPDTPILGTTNRAPEVEIPRLTNMVLIHAQAAIVNTAARAKTFSTIHAYHILLCDRCNTSHGLASHPHPRNYRLRP